MFSSHSFISCSFSPTDGKLATGSDDGSVKVWDFYKSVGEMSLRGHGGEVRGVSWHPSKCLLVTASKDSTQPIKLWDPKSGTSIATMYVDCSTECLVCPGSHFQTRSLMSVIPFPNISFDTIFPFPDTFTKGVFWM